MTVDSSESTVTGTAAVPGLMPGVLQMCSFTNLLGVSTFKSLDTFLETSFAPSPSSRVQMGSAVSSPLKITGVAGRFEP